MGLTVLFYVQFGVAILFGATFILTPVRSMKMYGIEDTQGHFTLVTRLYGTVVLMYCVVAWFAAGMDDSIARRGIAIAFAVSLGSGFIVFIPYMLKKTLNAFGWLPTFLQFGFTVSYIYFAIAMQV